MQRLPEALAPLARLRQFILYRVEPSIRKPGKLDKLPCDYRTGWKADAHDPLVQTDAATAIASAHAFGQGYGVGFVFTDNDPYFFIDIDNCLVNGQWSPLAVQLCEVFRGCAIERSLSGTGLHIFGVAAVGPHRKKNVPYGLEFYHRKRFVALTGTDAVGSVDFMPDPRAITWLIENYFPGAEEDETVDITGLTDAPRVDWRGPTDDSDLIRRASMSLSAKAAFGQGASFNDLWLADAAVLARAFPSQTGDAYDRSSADGALSRHLAFWTGCHGTRMLRLMRMSSLAREKWDREDYLPLTIATACASQLEVLQDKPLVDASAASAPQAADTVRLPPGGAFEMPSLTAMTGVSILGPDHQRDLFKQTCYITDAHAALTHEGEILKPEQFRVRFGGFTFIMDFGNERTTRDAWECFTQSQAFRPERVDTTCFRPDLPPLAIVKRGGVKAVNFYWPIDIPRAKGSVEPLLRHLAKLFPNEHDRRIIISYMAAVVQHKGVKFQWCPLIQGVEGNGKSFLTTCVANAVGRRYVHLPRADQISAKFNPWVHGKILIGVEDVFVPSDQQERWEILKPMITADQLPIEPKGVDQRMVDVCCNWMLNSNHRDGIRKTRGDRRLAPFYTPHQQREDLQHDGLTAEYFRSLVDWYRNGGMEFVNEFLYTCEIDPELNPANGGIAPVTTSTDEAITAGLGFVEQSILEAIEQGETGFRGGWVSSTKLDQLLERLGFSRRIPPSKRAEIMKELGYELHPGLPDGRTPTLVMPDGARPRLYIRRTDVPLRSINGANEIGKAYSSAQQTS